MRGGSRLDRYLGKALPGYVPGTLSSETVAFAAALDCVARELPEVAHPYTSNLDEPTTLSAGRAWQIHWPWPPRT